MQLHRGMARLYARRLKVRFEFDDFTLDDLEQAGTIGVWHAVKTYEKTHGTTFSTHMYLCVRQHIWAEFIRLKRQQKRGFNYLAEKTKESISSDRPAIDSELADTELIAVIRRGLRAIPEDTRMSIQWQAHGRTLDVIGRALGMTRQAVHSRYWWGIERLREMVLPLAAGR